MKIHEKTTIEQLGRIDSPTVSNAIERFRVRPMTSGYAGLDLRCVFPEMSTMIGYAVTCTADSTTETRSNPEGIFSLWEAVRESPRPSVLVIKDIGHAPDRSCHLGEVMATTAKALGSVGCVTDGGLRDIHEIRALGGFQLFCAGFVVSHGNPVICEVGVEVEISGMNIGPGDLLHGDVNGLLAIPAEIADQVAEEADRVRQMEAEIMNYVKSPEFTVRGLADLRKKFTH